MKIRLEKKMQWIISKFMGSKNEKYRLGGLREKRNLDLRFVYRKHWMKAKLMNMWYVHKSLSNWNLIA